MYLSLAFFPGRRIDESIVLTSTSMAGSPCHSGCERSASQPSKSHISCLRIQRSGSAGDHHHEPGRHDPVPRMDRYVSARIPAACPHSHATDASTSASLPTGATTFELAYNGRDNNGIDLNVGHGLVHCRSKRNLRGWVIGFRQPNGHEPRLRQRRLSHSSHVHCGPNPGPRRGSPHPEAYLDFQDAGGLQPARSVTPIRAIHCTSERGFKPRLSGPRDRGIVLTRTLKETSSAPETRRGPEGPLPRFCW